MNSHKRLSGVTTVYKGILGKYLPSRNEQESLKTYLASVLLTEPIKVESERGDKRPVEEVEEGKGCRNPDLELLLKL